MSATRWRRRWGKGCPDTAGPRAGSTGTVFRAAGPGTGKAWCIFCASWGAGKCGADGLLARAVARRGIRPGAHEVWIVAFLHVTELLGRCVNAPQLVASFSTGDEHAVLVPAMHPGDAVIEAEEASLDTLAALILDLAGLLSILVVGLQEIASKDSGAMNGDWPW